MPDAELFAAAAAGTLRDKAEVSKQAQRLLATAKGGLSVDHLHFQMYRLGTYDGIDSFCALDSCMKCPGANSS